MGLLSHSMDTLSLTKSRRTSVASAHDGEVGDANPNDTSELDKDEGNILMALIAQLRPGMDLSKIALPTFVLEPRSLLERITDFFSHPELIFGANDEEDPKARFLAVMSYYLSGWHIKPKGVKKPWASVLSPHCVRSNTYLRYNPVLGEIFRCSYFYPDGSEGFYVAEQVSHHPPVSAFFYVSPKNGVLITGELKPKSRFLGNSAATIMEGQNRVRLLRKPEDGDYDIGVGPPSFILARVPLMEYVQMPNMYARGILFGKMQLELGDTSSIVNPKTDYSCDVEFKTKGWISGGYNAVAGRVKGPGKSEQGEVIGHWDTSMEYTDRKTSKRSVCFDAATAQVVPKSVLPESEQEENESRRLWSKLTEAVKASDMVAATTAKSAVEDHQRDLVRQREATGAPAPDARFFVHVAGDKWMPKIGVDTLPKDPAEMEEKVRKWIFGDKSPQKSDTIAASPKSPVSGKPKSPSVAPVVVPAAPTAPGPPAPGPKASHPI
ncbi:hypothetical protein P7C73_g599, partial [Tremellales sp. Uapishka_1]